MLVNKDGSKRLEWFYLEQKFGVHKSDLAQKAKSELHPHTGQSWPRKPNNNKEGNREENIVNGVVKREEKGSLQQLKGLEQPPEQTMYVAHHILKALGDEKSRKFYELVAAKIPEGVIQETLSQIKVDGARDPAKLFTYRMQRYAFAKQKG